MIFFQEVRHVRESPHYLLLNTAALAFNLPSLEFHMHSGRTLLTATAIAALSGAALGTDGDRSLSGNRQHQGPPAAAQQPAVDVEWDEAIMILAGELELVEDQEYSRPSLSVRATLAGSGDGSHRHPVGPDQAVTKPRKAVAGHCGTDDFFQDWDVPRFSEAPTIIEVPFRVRRDSSEKPSFISVDKLKASFNIYPAESSAESEEEPQIIGEIFIGENGRYSLATFSASKNRTSLDTFTRVPVDAIREYTLVLRLSSNSSLAYAGELDLGSLLKVEDRKAKPAGDVDIDWSNARVRQQEDDSAIGPRGDLTGDGLVNTGDFNALLSAWGTEDGDLNGDGATNGQDLGIMLLLMETCWG